MVRLGTRFAVTALWAAVLLFVVPANAQWAVAPALQQQQDQQNQQQAQQRLAQQQQASQQQPQTQPQQTPPPATAPLHWRAQGNTVQPVAQNPQQPAAAPVAQPTPQTPPQAVPAATPGSQPAPAAKAAAAPASRKRSSRTSKTQVAEVPATPPPPPTLDQLPPVPPQVHYQNGQLTINAQNSTLSQVLHAVQAQTGASVDVPSSAGSERVAMQIGPGQPRDVLNTLLNGSRFDYVILGVAGDPGAVQRVILTPRQTGAPVGTATAQNTPAPPPQEAEEEGAVAESEPEYQNQNPVTPPPGGFRRPGIPVPQQQPPDQNSFAPAGEQPNGAKSPEQLMQELQQMQQQQQQLQEQLNPANRPQQQQ